MATEIVNFSDLNRSGKSFIVKSIGYIPELSYIVPPVDDITILNKKGFDVDFTKTFDSICKNRIYKLDSLHTDNMEIDDADSNGYSDFREIYRGIYVIDGYTVHVYVTIVFTNYDDGTPCVYINSLSATSPGNHSEISDTDTVFSLINDIEYEIIEFKNNDNKSFSSLYGRDAAETEDEKDIDDYEDTDLTNDGYKALDKIESDIKYIFSNCKQIAQEFKSDLESHNSDILSDLLEGTKIEIGVYHTGQFYPIRFVE